MYPVVLYKQGEIPIDFITSPKTKDKLVEGLVGRQININKIDKFDFLLENRIPIKVRAEREKTDYIIQCPKPSAFLYHKGTAFIDREGELTQAKDLYYMYFILCYTPNLDIILAEVVEYKKNWSSSEYDADYACCQDFTSGANNVVDFKHIGHYVRAVWAF
jgi:hypothetical protein